MKEFINYFKRHKDIFIWTLIFACFCQGIFLLSGNAGIDTAEAIMTKGQNHYYVCLNMGRQGLVFLKAITGTLLINPYVIGVLSLLLLWLSSIIWTYLFYYITKKDNNIVLLLSNILFLSTPLHIETFYFKIQCTEFMINFCLIGISLLWTYIWIDKKKISYLIGSALLMLIFMGTYQALTVVYIAGAQMIFLLYYFFVAKEYKFKDIFMFIVKLIFPFLQGFIFNQIITRIFFSKGNVYYEDIMHWGNDTFKRCLYEIAKYCGRYLIGNSIYYPILFTALLVISFIYILVLSVKEKKPLWFWLIVILGFTMLTPVYLSIVLGGNIVYRTQVVYPFVTLFFAYFILSFIDTKLKGKFTKCLYNILIAIIVVTSFINLKNSLSLTYTDHMRYVEDSFIAQDIINRIEAIQDDESSIPVFFHGAYERELNPSCVYGESVGRSMFAQDTDVEPVGYYSTIRCIAYLSQFGKTYNFVNDYDQVEFMNITSNGMPEYPNDGCVYKANDVIIVNLNNN